MLDEADFRSWCSRLRLTQAAREAIAAIRSGRPARCVGGGRRNVAGRCPARHHRHHRGIQNALGLWRRRCLQQQRGWRKQFRHYRRQLHLHNHCYRNSAGLTDAHNHGQPHRQLSLPIKCPDHSVANAFWTDR